MPFIDVLYVQVPSKLLIQVPRFGKKFKTFQKIIPSEVLNVADVVDLEIPCRFRYVSIATKPSVVCVFHRYMPYMWGKGSKTLW